MDISNLIFKKLKTNKKVKVAEIVKATGFSRTYVNRFFKELKKDGKIALIGKANKAFYVLALGKNVFLAKKSILSIRRSFRNKNISEDLVLDGIRQNSGIFFRMPKNISDIIDYAFTEMLNNAIEHSRSGKIEIKMERNGPDIQFEVRDWGVGIFINIMEKRGLKNELEAIQDLLKGKQTTVPEEHTGEGIFFTSRVADRLLISSSNKKLIFDNTVNDIFIGEIKEIKGTKIIFEISSFSKRKLPDIFKKYTSGNFIFDKTEVTVKLFELSSQSYISRSQARRLLFGLEKFKKIILDFKKVDTLGQAFADEVFRVWHKKHPSIEIEYINAGEVAEFMIKRILSGSTLGVWITA